MFGYIRVYAAKKQKLKRVGRLLKNVQFIKYETLFSMNLSTKRKL